MEVNGQFNASAALPPGNRAPAAHWLGASVDPVWTLWRRQKSHPCRELNPVFQPPIAILKVKTAVFVLLYLIL
jgi:hypothetical protein